MSDLSNEPTPRREFLGQLAASAVVLAGGACAAPAAAVQSPTAPTPGAAAGAQTHWDDSWFGRLTAKHKAVFDSPGVEDGFTGGPGHATRYLNGMRDALGVKPGEAQVVVVIRHTAIPFVFSDAMWEKYPMGELRNIKSGDKFATRNPVGGPRPNARAAADSTADRPQANLQWLLSHGHIVLGCDVATQGLGAQIAQKVKGDARAIADELRANVVPGVILQPNGVYAVHRAQEAGCTFIHSI
jgi:hypothetical protein